MGHRARNGDQEVWRLAPCQGLGRHTTNQQRAGAEPTWNRMTVETLHFVLRDRGVVQQVPNTVCACERVPVPSDRRRRAVELWNVHGPRRRVIRGVKQTSELVRSTGRDFDAVGISGTGHGVNGTHSYSSRVRVLILSGSRGPRSECYLLGCIGYVVTKTRGDYPQTLTTGAGVKVAGEFEG